MADTAGTVITCKAAVVWEPGQPFAIENVQVAPPKAHEVRVKILFAALCHTDIHFWKIPGQWFPRILGHEAAGIVESVGEGVTDVQVGDHVIPVFAPECKECSYCKHGNCNVCEIFFHNFQTGVSHVYGTTPFSIDGKPVYHFLGISTFSEYSVMHSLCVAKVNPAAPLEKICLLGCGVPTGLGSAWKIADVKPGSTVAVFGLGTVGLAVAEGAKMAGATQIIGVDIDPEKLEKAKDFGVTDVFNSKDCGAPIQEVIRKATNGGVDYSFECVGNNDVVLEALQSSHPVWGVAVVVGYIPPDKKISISTSEELLFGRKWTSGIYGGFKGKTDLPHLVEMSMKDLDLDKYISKYLPFTDFNDAIELLLKGKVLRVVLKM